MATTHQIFNSIGNFIYNGILYKNFYSSENFHNSYEFVYIFEGDVKIKVNETTIELSKKEAILIAPNEVHSFLPSENVMFIGVFTSDFVSSFNTQCINSFAKFTFEKTMEDFLIKNLFYTGTPDFLLLKSCLYSICSAVNDFYSSETVVSKITNTDFVYSVNRYITENLDNDFTQRDVAKYLGYEYHYFSNLFHKYIKTGFINYVNSYRYKTASIMLQKTDKKIADIAYDCGFKSIRSFNRIFKNFTGKTPNEYRKENCVVHEIEEENLPVLEYITKEND